MKRHLLSMMIMVSSLILTGCATLMSNNKELSEVKVQAVPTAIASIARADAYSKDGGFVVTGTLRRMHEVKFPGHVDVRAYGAEGLVEAKVVVVRGLSSKRRGAMNLPFSVTFDLNPDAIKKVTVEYHAPPYDGEIDNMDNS